jgi:hypothetical protein
MEYVTSDHRVASSSPAGCKLLEIKYLRYQIEANSGLSFPNYCLNSALIISLLEIQVLCNFFFLFLSGGVRIFFQVEHFALPDPMTARRLNTFRHLQPSTRPTGNIRASYLINLMLIRK